MPLVAALVLPGSHRLLLTALAILNHCGRCAILKSMTVPLPGGSDKKETIMYSAEFYEETVPGALRSAQTIIPILLAHVPVRSAVDVGCGHGAWLHALEQYDVTDIIGYDGTYVDQSKLLIDPAHFRVIDLRDNFEIGRTFDLAISLEVAEHLPSQFADLLIQRLVSAAPIVLFSAAIPGQIGLHHENLQWQDYWRSIFKTFGFQPVDLIRPKIWGHLGVEYWYQQNTILYCSDNALGNHQLDESEFAEILVF